MRLIEIIREHYKTLIQVGKEKLTKIQIVKHFILPLGVIILIVYFYQPSNLALNSDCCKELNYTIIGIILTSISILTGLLFNMLLVVIDIAHKWQEKANIKKAPKHQELANTAKELFYNIVFNVFLGVILIILLLISLIEIKSLLLSSILSIGIYYFLVKFVINIVFMVFNIYDLLDTDLDGGYK